MGVAHNRSSLILILFWSPTASGHQAASLAGASSRERPPAAANRALQGRRNAIFVKAMIWPTWAGKSENLRGGWRATCLAKVEQSARTSRERTRSVRPPICQALWRWENIFTRLAWHYYDYYYLSKANISRQSVLRQLWARFSRNMARASYCALVAAV